MENKKEVQKKMLNRLSIELSKYGFDKKVHGQSLWKPIEGGRSMIHVNFIEHESDFDITISVSIRIDLIEDMINSTNKLLTKSEKQSTSTIGCELGNLVRRSPKRYSINDSVNLDAVTSEIMEAIKVSAFPFIEKYSNLENLMETMLSDDENVWLLTPLHHRRAQNAVALAKLFNSKDIESIIENKRVFLESRKDFGLKLFNEFAKVLMK